MFDCDLTEVIEVYQEMETDAERTKYINALVNYIWEYGTCIIKKKKSIKINVNRNKLPQDVCDVFEKHSSIEYTTFSSKKIDDGLYNWRGYLIRGLNRIYLNEYNLGCDCDTKYIRLISKPKDLYFAYINRLCDVPTASMVEQKINEMLVEAQQYKDTYLKRKRHMDFKEFQSKVEMFLHKTFSNYKSFDEYVAEHGEKDIYDRDDFDEDNYTVAYILKSLRLYFKNDRLAEDGLANYKLKKKSIKKHSRDERFVYCEQCGKLMVAKSSAAKYCDDCKKERNRIRMAEVRKKAKLITED